MTLCRQTRVSAGTLKDLPDKKSSLCWNAKLTKCMIGIVSKCLPVFRECVPENEASKEKQNQGIEQFPEDML